MRSFASSLISVLSLALGVHAQGGDIWSDLESTLSSSAKSEVSASPSSSSLVSSSGGGSSSSVAYVSSSSSEASSSSVPVQPIPSSSSVAPAPSSSSTLPVETPSVSSSSATEPTSAAESLPVASEAFSSSSQVSSSSVASSSSGMSRRELLGPVKVSRVHAIDELKGKYRSPRRALFMSLVLPGSGQLYVGGSTFNYVRGGAYLAAEAALISGWYYNSVYKYDKQVKKYKDFARSHYSVGKYETKVHGLWNQLADDTQEEVFHKLYGTVRSEYCDALYGNSSQFGCYDEDHPFANDGAHLANFDTVSLGASLASSSNKGLPAHEGDFYRLLAEDEFVLGWDDADSVRTVAELDIGSSEDYSYVSLGSSDNLVKYKDMRTRATELADMQAWFLGGLLLNHIVSAVDATLAARAHNMALYEERVTWWDKVRFDSRIAVNDGFAAALNARWGF